MRADRPARSCSATGTGVDELGRKALHVVPEQADADALGCRCGAFGMVSDRRRRRADRARAPGGAGCPAAHVERAVLPYLTDGRRAASTPGRDHRARELDADLARGRLAGGSCAAVGAADHPAPRRPRLSGERRHVRGQRRPDGSPVSAHGRARGVRSLRRAAGRVPGEACWAARCPTCGASRAGAGGRASASSCSRPTTTLPTGCSPSWTSRRSLLRWPLTSTPRDGASSPPP